MYRENAERSRVQRQAQDFQEFLRELELRVEITAPTPVQLDRVAQLTQRTNQFNFTTIRRTESEIRQLAEMELECRIVEVCDRFGDYGLVGVLIYGMGTESLEIDTFLLSCRVLGRGVEHRMLNYLGDTAHEAGVGFRCRDCDPDREEPASPSISGQRCGRVQEGFRRKGSVPDPRRVCRHDGS